MQNNETYDTYMYFGPIPCTGKQSVVGTP